jgi:hypothetical protein
VVEKGATRGSWDGGCAREPHAIVAQGQCSLFIAKLTPLTPLHTTGAEALFDLK